jgi:RNA polymerase sigma-70 factor (ECF subfamily)
MGILRNYDGAALLLDSFHTMAKSGHETESQRHGGIVNSGSEPADEILMERVVRGDRKAFEQLVHRHTARMYAIARRVSGRAEEAEEVVQEGFLRVWVHAGTWSPQKGAFAVWLARIVVNLCIDRLRSDRYEPLEDEEALVEEREDVLSELFRRQMAERVARAVADLPLRQRTALALCYYEGFSNAEAAEILGVTVGALEALLVRARCTLRGRLAALSRI